MKGIVKMFNHEKGFGFISGQDGDVFFHISKVINNGLIPEIGTSVEFEQDTNEKGLFAYDVHLIERNNNSKPEFLRIGDSRIKLSNVKIYGIERDESILNYAKNCENGITNLTKECDRCKEAYRLEKAGDQARGYSYGHPCRDRYEDVQEKLNKEKNEYAELIESVPYKLALKGNLRYLYIETYQGNSYKFYEYECDWDLDEKLALLDKYLCE